MSGWAVPISPFIMSGWVGWLEPETCLLTEEENDKAAFLFVCQEENCPIRRIS